MNKDIGTGIPACPTRSIPRFLVGFLVFLLLSPRRWVAATGLRQLWQGSNCQIAGAPAAAGANRKS
ncbi:MAG: hypothetical protein MUC60_12425 [Oscillatoria sp. Prado101]|nr:hypothetical protein [Oscillatoria sp. Prado101]